MRVVSWALSVGTLLVTVTASAQDQTVWRKVDKSLSMLLDEGWRVESMTNAQTFRREYLRESNPANTFAAISLASVPVGFEYNFLLSKGGKWVLCIVASPELDSASSRCRALN